VWPTMSSSSSSSSTAAVDTSDNAYRWATADTPLVLLAACDGTCEDLKSALTAFPASISIVDENMQTPLHIASQRSDGLALVELLIEHKADVNAKVLTHYYIERGE
jgi:ankyrin repeat protein